jgi:sulfite exporter TauE/SafE
MIELPLIFLSGVLGTAHCLGMCGPFALTIGGTAHNWIDALTRQMIFTAGRVFTYGMLGVSAGYFGWKVSHATADAVKISAALAIGAGLWLAYQGLRATGMFRGKAVGRTTAPCLGSGFLGHFLRQPGPQNLFLAGVFTGFLPCGLLYGMLAMAMSTHSVLWGGITMVAFGLGTAPGLVSAGVTGRLLGLGTRKNLFAVAAWCLVLTGAISVARGATFLSTSTKSAAHCPMCQP